MSKIRYEQTENTSHRGHLHDGLNGSKLQYDKALHSQPKLLNNARETKLRLIGQQGTVDYLEHGCGYTPIVKCYVGGKEVKIRINIDRTTGFVTWNSEQEFTRTDEAYLVIYGLSTEYIIDDDAPEVDLSEYWCGYEWNVNDSDPTVTRITGNGMEDYFLRDGGGILKGKLFKYVAVNPVTKEEVEVPIDDAEAYENYRYGQYGDLFAKMRGQLYYKVEKEGDIRRKKLSRYPLPGFRPYHSNDYIVYIGLYEASCDNERTKIYSRVTPESEYTTHVGGNKDNRFTEKLYNMPATAISTPTFSNIAHSKGEGYDIMDYMTRLMLSDLFMAEFGTRNSQLPIMGADDNGYSQGGLGKGCSPFLNHSDWVNYNNVNPISELGTTDIFGSGCGENEISCIKNGILIPDQNWTKQNRFYGIESIFGHIGILITGIHVLNEVDENDTNITIKSVKAYICDDPEKFFLPSNRDNDSFDEEEQRKSGYVLEGYTVNLSSSNYSEWFIKDVIFNKFGSFIPLEYGGFTNSYFCDGALFGAKDYIKSGLSSVHTNGTSWYAGRNGIFLTMSHETYKTATRKNGTRLCLYKQPYDEMPFFVEDASGEENEVVIAKKASANEIVDAPLAPDVSLEYSYDTVNWKTLPITSTEGYTIYLPPNGRVYLRGDNYTLCNRYDNVDIQSYVYRYTHISCNNNFNLGGNIMSLLYKDFIGKRDLTNNGEYTFAHLFTNNTKLISSNKLVLPATILQNGCYAGLFNNCTNQVSTIKQLPSNKINHDAYLFMYSGNINLLHTPKESFTEVHNYSLFGMYRDNKKIIEHKTLINIRTLLLHYSNFTQIFCYCSNLKLVYAPRVDYDNTNDTFTEWLTGVSTTGTIYISYDVDWRSATRNGSGIPEGWEIKYIDPDTMEERESLYPIE